MQRIHLAPMAGVTDLAFRDMVNKYGIFGVRPATTVTEMVSSRGLYYGDKKTIELLRTHDEDRKNLLVQIFGNEPAVMADAAGKLMGMGFRRIDINFGCPAKKIVKNGDGGALLANPRLIGEIIEAVQATGVEVSIKIRLDNAAEVVRIATGLGVRRIAVHGRTVAAGYTGAADWGAIKELRSFEATPRFLGAGLTGLPRLTKARLAMTDTVCPFRLRLGDERRCNGRLRGKKTRLAMTDVSDDIIFIANGDISEGNRPSEADFGDIMVGRAAMDFSPEHAFEHLDLIRGYKGERGILEARRVMLWYFRDKRLRVEIVRANSFDEMKEIILKHNNGHGVSF